MHFLFHHFLFNHFLFNHFLQIKHSRSILKNRKYFFFTKNIDTTSWTLISGWIGQSTEFVDSRKSTIFKNSIFETQTKVLQLLWSCWKEQVSKNIIFFYFISIYLFISLLLDLHSTEFKRVSSCCI